MRGHFAFYVLGVAVLGLTAVLLLFTTYAAIVTEAYLEFLLMAVTGGSLADSRTQSAQTALGFSARIIPVRLPCL